MADVCFSVDPDGLDTLRARLSAIESGMRDIGQVVSGYGPLDLGPNPDVWNALQSFHGDWSDGLAVITRNVAALAGLLAKAAGDYRGTEDQIAQAAAPQTGPAL
jgi:hypothetical protein